MVKSLKVYYNITIAKNIKINISKKGVIFINNLLKYIWGRPNKISERNLHRQVSYLELFWDVAFATYFSTLAVDLSSNINAGRIVTHIFLFTLVWFSWLNGMQYHDLHGNDDIRSRFFAFVHMFCVIGMTVFVSGAMDRYTKPFAIFYIVMQFVIMYEWWYTSVLDRNYIEAKMYTMCSFAGGCLFLISLFVPIYFRNIFWMASLLFTMFAPFSMLLYDSQKIRRQRLYILTKSMKSRFSRLFIIVLAEIISGVVAGISSHYFIDKTQLVYLFTGLLMSFGIFAVYFDAVSFKKIRNNRFCFFVYVFLHLPLMALISMLGASMRLIISNYWDVATINKVSPIIGYSCVGILVICGMLYILFEHKINEIRIWEDISTFVSAAAAVLVVIFVGEIKIAVYLYIVCLFMPVIVDFILNLDLRYEARKKKRLNDKILNNTKKS